MAAPEPLFAAFGGGLFDTLLPDFVLALVLFTALAYAGLEGRFRRQRPAIAIAVVLALALTVGLVRWEYAQGLSLRNLGPVAVGLVLLVLALAVFRAIRQAGGTWAGVGIGIGTALLAAGLVGTDWQVAAEFLQTVTAVALVVGLMAFLLHIERHGHSGPVRVPVMPRTQRDRRDVRAGRIISDQLGTRLRRVRRESEFLDEQPDLEADVVQSIKRMLPAEGWLTQRLAELRKRAHQVRHGHVARLKETKEVFAKLPVSAKKRASGELIQGYHKLAGIDKRLERLDHAAAANEKRIRELTAEAGKAALRHDHRRLTELVAEAEKLQKHNSRLFTIIDRTENKLRAVAERVAQQAREVDGA